MIIILNYIFYLIIKEIYKIMNNTTSDDIQISHNTEDKVYLYLTLIVQALGSLTLIVIAVLRFINTRQNNRLNNIRGIYYTNKNKDLQSKSAE